MTRAADAGPLYSTLGDDPDLGPLVDMFVAEMPSRVQVILNHLQARDWDALQRAAHQLKGAAGSYGFHSITQEATVVERVVRDRQSEAEILAAVQALASLCERARGG